MKWEKMRPKLGGRLVKMFLSLICRSLVPWNNTLINVIIRRVEIFDKKFVCRGPTNQ